MTGFKQVLNNCLIDESPAFRPQPLPPFCIFTFCSWRPATSCVQVIQHWCWQLYTAASFQPCASFPAAKGSLRHQDCNCTGLWSNVSFWQTGNGLTNHLRLSKSSYWIWMQSFLSSTQSEGKIKDIVKRAFTYLNSIIVQMRSVFLVLFFSLSDMTFSHFS